jgi:myo-inositol-1(or 4)-monophosphatase
MGPEMSATNDTAALARFAEELAAAAAAAIMPHFRRPLEITDKRELGLDVRYSPVTVADRDAEQAMRALIAERFPEHGIIGEEFGAEREAARRVWILDPIDGTKAFISGLPLWGTLIGLLEEGRPVLGLMHQPFTGETFLGMAGDGAWLNGAPIAVSGCTRLAEARAFSTDVSMFETAAERAMNARLTTAVRMRRYGGDCYGFAMLAAGQIDLMVENGLQPYDILPLVPLIEGAGGIVTTWDGGAPDAGGRIVAAASPELHADALAVLAEAL